jgi:hypothetical protein
MASGGKGKKRRREKKRTVGRANELEVIDKERQKTIMMDNQDYLHLS